MNTTLQIQKNKMKKQEKTIKQYHSTDSTDTEKQEKTTKQYHSTYTMKKQAIPLYRYRKTRKTK